MPSTAPNGVSCQVHRLANRLVRNGHEITCFSCSPAPADALYKTIQSPPPKTLSKLKAKFFPALYFRSIDKSGFDILHFHGDDYLTPASGRRVRTFYGSALFEALHARQWPRRLYQALFYGFEWLSLLRRGVTVGIAPHSRRALPFINHIVPCGIAPERFFPAPHLKTEHPSLLFIGDCDSRKQGRLLLDMFTNTILPKHPSCRLSIVGPWSGSRPAVRFCGRISEQELVAEYQRAWVLCVSSAYEGFGVPIIEAMACGTAVVACKNGTAEHIIDHGRNGMLCTAATLAQTIQ
ncbi:MAG: glycosyltransferase family 4 protein, partial [Chitinivibrionales bacterium]|nr:glycosyltransferase family 4 protein [Chitinivibrionales bacterium]